MAELVRAVLEVDAVDLRTNFFEAGGDSLASVRLVDLADDRGLALTVADVFEAQTVGELAAIADRRAAEEHSAAPSSP